MRAKFIEGNKPEKYIHVVRNVDQGSVSSISTIFNSIPRGTPLILDIGTTLNPSTYQNGLPPGVEDGLQVVLPISAANNVNYGFGTVVQNEFYHYGIAVNDIQYGQIGESLMHGVHPFALVVRATRSASSASWTSSASIAGGQLLSVDTVNNAYLTVASSNASNPLSFAPVTLLDSIASMAASATATTDTRTAIITQQRVFVREM